MRAVLRSGGSVAACKFESGEFKFELFDDELRIAEFMGEKVNDPVYKIYIVI